MTVSRKLAALKLSIEIIDLLPTGEQFHCYLDPEREVPAKVVEITGLTTEFLTGKPKFASQAQAFLDFIGDSPLIAHNARFDMGFINAELVRAGFEALPESRFKDTLAMAHEKFPGSPASLDALCKRFDISLSGRDKHGAIIDSELLAAVYLELNGGRAMRLGLDGSEIDTPKDDGSEIDTPKDSFEIKAARPRPETLKSSLSEAEALAHKVLVEDMGDKAVWQKVWRKQNRH